MERVLLTQEHLLQRRDNVLSSLLTPSEGNRLALLRVNLQSVTASLEGTLHWTSDVMQQQALRVPPFKTQTVLVEKPAPQALKPSAVLSIRPTGPAGKRARWPLCKLNAVLHS